MSKTTETSVSVETIVSGNFNKTGKKNFSGLSLDGTRYFISSKLLQAIGIVDDVTFAENSPLYAIIGTNTYNEYVTADDVESGTTNHLGEMYKPEDVGRTFKTFKAEDGSVKRTTFDRAECVAVFTDEEALTKAVTAKSNLLKSISHQTEMKDLELAKERALRKAEITFEIKKKAESEGMNSQEFSDLMRVSLDI